jgi:hybrid polyketide synthase / nonribosomal peptide synthetase FtdB
MLQNEFGIKLSINQLFQYSKLNTMSKVVENSFFNQTNNDTPYSVFNPNQKKIIYCFPPAGGYSIVYRTLAEKIPDFTLMSFNYITDEDKVNKYADIIAENDMQSLWGFVTRLISKILAFDVAYLINILIGNKNPIKIKYLIF